MPPVGNTVDVANATWTNTIGTPELITVWQDPKELPKAIREVTAAFIAAGIDPKLRPENLSPEDYARLSMQSIV